MYRNVYKMYRNVHKMYRNVHNMYRNVQKMYINDNFYSARVYCKSLNLKSQTKVKFKLLLSVRKPPTVHRPLLGLVTLF